MTRIFSAIENDEKDVLEQLDKDIDIAKEDGVCDTDQYTITASDDEIVLHDKVNDEDTEIVEEENGDTTFSAVDKTFADNPEVERLQKRLDQLKDNLNRKKASLDELYADEDEEGVSTHADQVENEIQRIKDEIDKVKEQIKKAKEKKFSGKENGDTTFSVDENELVDVVPDNKEFSDEDKKWVAVFVPSKESRRTGYTKVVSEDMLKSIFDKDTKYEVLGKFDQRKDAKEAADKKSKTLEDPYKFHIMRGYSEKDPEEGIGDFSDEELDKTVEFSSVKASRVKNFSLESLKSFAKGGWKDGKLYIKMGDSDVALDLKNKVAIILDENLSCPIDPKKSVIDNLTTVEKFMKENDLKVFSKMTESDIMDKFSKKQITLKEIEKWMKESNRSADENLSLWWSIYELAKKKNIDIHDPKIKGFSDTNPTPEQEGVINFLKGFVEEHPGEAKYLVELGAKWGPDNLLEGLNHDAKGDKTESKNFSDDSNLIKLSKKLAALDTELLEYIDEKDWEKFDKLNKNTQMGYRMIADGLLGWNNITDANIRSFVLDRAQDIQRASGTELSILEDYMEKLIKFVSSKGQKMFSEDKTYVVYQEGGSIGEKFDSRVGSKPVKIIKEGLTEQEAKDMKSRWNKMLSPGEKKYYRISYKYCPSDKVKKLDDSKKFSKFSPAVAKMFDKK